MYIYIDAPQNHDLTSEIGLIDIGPRDEPDLHLDPETDLCDLFSNDAD